jgi:hypothetical protein
LPFVDVTDEKWTVESRGPERNKPSALGRQRSAFSQAAACKISITNRTRRGELHAATRRSTKTVERRGSSALGQKSIINC